MTTDSKSSEIAACDCQILMWAFPWAMRSEKKKQTLPQNVPEMRRRAKLLMRLLHDNGIQLCIPSVVVAELLAPLDPRNHTKLITAFEEHFFCPPFDLRGCGLAAQLWQFERGRAGESTGLPQEVRSERRVLKADMLIVASAKMAGANRFYSNDEKCRRLAGHAGMHPLDLPTSTGNFLTDMAVDEDQAAEDAGT